MHPSQSTGLSVKGLFGGGQATLSNTAAQVLLLPDLRGGPFGRLDPAQVRREPVTTVFRYRENFAVAEPELDLRIKLSGRVHVSVGVGYRFVGTEFHDNNRLHGAVGSVGLQIGGGG